jgi:hypothetical protein
MILEYKMHMTEKGMRTPEWVEDGGYWLNSTDNTRIGWSPDEADREYYIPDTVTTLTAAELDTRVLALHAANPFTDPDGTELTNEEVSAQVTAWVNARS